MIAKRSLQHKQKQKHLNKKSHSSKPQTIRGLEQQKSQKVQTISAKVKFFFGNTYLNEIAKKSKFLIRNTSITPFIFLYALSLGLFGVGETSLDLLAINMNSLFGLNITGSAFCQRMSEKKSVLYLKYCFEAMLKLQLESSFTSGFGKVFSKFKGVILEDSTTVELNEKASPFFKGCGGCSSKSSFKLNWVFDICSYAAVAVSIFEGKVPDQKFAKKSLALLKKRMLIIRDLGYLSLEALKIINTKGAYYLSRLRKGMCVYLREDDKTSVDMLIWLKKITAKGKSAKVSVFIGKEEREPVQLIAQKVPSWVYKQRIKKYKRKKDGREPSDDYIALAKYSIFITNIPDDLWNLKEGEIAEVEIATIIIEIYKIRWQIELLFKTLKSKIKLNVIKGKSKNQILCLIYGRLIALMLSLMILSYASSQTYKGREASLLKVASWLVSENRLAKAILRGTFGNLYRRCLKDLKLLCKDKRNRETALDKLVGVFNEEKLVA